MSDTERQPGESSGRPAFEDDPFASAYPESREFWAAAAEGRLLVRHCDGCDRAHWYPRPICPLCGSTRTRWRQASGHGRIHAFSPARRADPPYTLAYVTLDEGPMLMTNIIDAPVESLRIDQPVQVRFQASTEGRMMPFFAPA